MSRPAKRRINARREFHVHLFPIVRIKVTGVMARSYRDAVQKALECQPPNRLHDRFDTDDSEYAEGFSDFLVDVAGDQNFRRSRCYHSREQPLIQLLEKLVNWHREPGRRIRQLDFIVTEARKALQMTV